MFIFTMSGFFRPYLASNSSAKMASSNVLEHSRPMLNRNGLDTLPALRSHIVGGDDVWHPMPDQRQALVALLLRFAQWRAGSRSTCSGSRRWRGSHPWSRRRPAWPSTRRRPRPPTPTRRRCSRARAARSASPTRTRRPGPSCGPCRRWPASATAGARCPYISSGSRTRPNRCMSAAGSHARNRGHARVHVVQPFSPWMQLSRPSSSSRWNGMYLPSSCS